MVPAGYGLSREDNAHARSDQHRIRNERAARVILALTGGTIPAWVDEWIVVDNGSTDRTAQRALENGARVVREPSRGYGAACLAGLAVVGAADIIVFLDADFSDDPRQMDRLVKPIADGAGDLVIGSRTLGRCEAGALTPAQRWGNHLSCRLIDRLWHFRCTDLGPFRAIRTDALALLRMDDRAYGWTIQMQIRAVRAGLRAVEVSVDYRRRIGRSKISGTLSGAVGAGVTILRTVFRERRRPRSYGRARWLSERPLGRHPSTEV